jgi:hypothetical protein
VVSLTLRPLYLHGKFPLVPTACYTRLGAYQSSDNNYSNKLSVCVIKIRRPPSFGEVKLSAPCRRILRRAKDLYEYEKRYFVDKIRNFIRPNLPDLLLDGSAGRIAGDIWWTNQSFPLSTSFHHGSPNSYIT